MGKLHTILLALIFFLALFLRVYQLDKVPVSLFGDEVDVGYQAYSVLKTGKDLYGNTLPVLIHSLSEYRVPLFIYSTVPFIGIFGLNEWGVRLPTAFWGVLGIIGVYLLTKKLFNEKVGLFAAAILSISPWHIHYSRAAFEVTMLLALIVFAVYFFLKGLEKKRDFYISAVLYSLTPYVYSTAAVFMPLLLLGLGIINFTHIKKNLKTYLIFAAIMGVVLAPYMLETFSGRSGERFGFISIFNNQELKDKVILAQNINQENKTEKIFHNMPAIWIQVFTLNYLRAFSPEFLFLQGDPNFRHSIHDMGQLHYFELILLLVGVFIIYKSDKKIKSLILLWLLLAPIPAVLTVDGGFHATRNFLMLAPLIMISAVGADHIWRNVNKINFKIAGGFVLLLVIINTSFFLHRYFVHFPVESWRAWHYGFKEAMQYVKDNQSGYQSVLINNSYEPSLIRFLFWNQYQPELFHQQFTLDKPNKNITLGFDGFKLGDKYYFGRLNGPFEQNINSKILLIASARDEITNPQTLTDSRVRLLQVIYSPTKEPIFYILTGVEL